MALPEDSYRVVSHFEVAGVKHLVELSKIWWNCVKHQPEPIRKASAEAAQGSLRQSTWKLLTNSPFPADTIRAPRVPLYW
jgi:hypothetical protein